MAGLFRSLKMMTVDEFALVVNDFRRKFQLFRRHARRKAIHDRRPVVERSFLDGRRVVVQTVVENAERIRR